VSLTIIQHNPEAAVTVAGPNDVGGEPGIVHLEVLPSWASLKPATARQVARAVLRFADLAGSRHSKATLSAAARELGRAGAVAGGKAAQAKLTREQRSERGRAAVQARWAKRHD